MERHLNSTKMPIPQASVTCDDMARQQRAAGTLHRVAALVRLRYLLIWAALRTSRLKIGMAAVFVALLVWLTISTLIGGAVAVHVASAAGESESVLEVGLAFVFLAAVAANVFLGKDVANAIPESVLLRYPIGAVTRFAVRWIIGIADPLWIIVAAYLSGIAVGLYVDLAQPIWVAILFCAYYFILTYCWAELAKLLTARLAEGRLGTLLGTIAIACALMFAFATTNPLLSRITHTTHTSISRMSQALEFSPPALCVGALAATSEVRAWQGLLLLLWLLVAIAGLAFLQNVRHDASTASGLWLYDRLERASSSIHWPVGAVFVKAFTYAARCNMVRYWVITVGPAMGILAPLLLLGYRLPETQRTTLLLACLYVASSTSTSPIATNQFGWDGPGVLRYGIIPVSLGSLVQAHSAASILFGLTAAVPTFFAFSLILRVHLSVSLLAIAACDAIAAILILNTCGAWLTLLSPKRMSFDATIGNGMPFPSTVMVFVGIQLPFVALSRAAQRGIPVFPGYWKWFVIMLIGSLLAYVLTLDRLRLAGEAQKQQLIGRLSCE